MGDGFSSFLIDGLSADILGSICTDGDCRVLSSPLPPSSASQVHPTEQNPPFSPELTHLHALLEEDDTPAEDEANLSLGMLVAYHAKASELAAILKEDSPALNLNFTLKSQHSSPLLPEAVPPSMHNPSLQIPDNRFFPLHGSGPPRTLAPPPYCVSTKLLDTELFKSIPAATLPSFINNPFSVRAEKEHRKASALRPRKEPYKIVGKPKEDVYVDLNHLLLRCANAIGLNDSKTAMDALLKVKQHASPDGDGAQRMAYYFVDALEARLAGTGWQVYLGQMRQQRASPKEILKASWMYMLNSPFAKAFRFFVNQMILGVAKEASVLHIMEYQFTGFQYPSLFKALAERPGGPPQVRLIAGNAPHYSMTSSQMETLHNRLEQTGRQLTVCAATFGVPFHFTAWLGTTGAFKMKDYVDPNRASYSTPFFSRRFREALYHFESQYDILDTFIERDSEDRQVFEREILGRAVLNLVACEETHVVEKVEKYNQCYASVRRVGLEQAVCCMHWLFGKVPRCRKGSHSKLFEQLCSVASCGYSNVGEAHYGSCGCDGKGPMQATALTWSRQLMFRTQERLNYQSVGL
ncbi:hypothetical protein GOP47_0022774 [Adiantum capillus-veneris]|uniref:Uncharacterized protein n=1 Tax=Adiantum capillus-veneris TaxID=13818 RepID=A0A9D4U6X6_ADICA|nr:hypothetical protein GOP47_0022774 [Adiantum capillus-veneris]